jgi:DNA-binding XRE family transcriptional regulator
VSVTVRELMSTVAARRALFTVFSRACVLSELEHDIESLLQGGMTAEELHEALEKHDGVSNREGTVAMVRRKLTTTRERVIWLEPSSAFLDKEESDRQSILGHLRRYSGWTLEQLADAVNTDPDTVALWENGAPIPDEPLKRCAEIFGVQPHFLARVH